MLVPLTNGTYTLNGTVKNFTPDLFPEVWDNFLVPLVNNLTGGAGDYNLAIFGAGRVAGLDYPTPDATKPIVPPSPALAVRLRNGARYEVADASGTMHEIVLTADTNLTDVPPSVLNAYGYLIAVDYEDGDGFILDWHPSSWTTSLQPALSAAGYPCVGAVTSGVYAVESINLDKEDRVYSNALFQKLLAAIGTGGGGSGGTVDLSAYATLEYVDDANEAQDAEIENLKNGLNAMPAPFDEIANFAIATALGLSEINPPSVERLEAAIVSSEAGHGQNSTPDYTPTTGAANELAWNPAQGEFG